MKPTRHVALSRVLIDVYIIHVSSYYKAQIYLFFYHPLFPRIQQKTRFFASVRTVSSYVVNFFTVFMSARRKMGFVKVFEILL